MKLTIAIYIVCLLLIIWGVYTLLNQTEWYHASMGWILIGQGVFTAGILTWKNKTGI